MALRNWLHGRIAAVAQRCVGVDVLPEWVAAMQDRGYEVVLQDPGSGLGSLADIAPFDVIVTTPNPYAPYRVRAAQLGIVWENVDHMVDAFPSGIAELAERHGRVLAEATTTDDRRPTTGGVGEGSPAVGEAVAARAPVAHGRTRSQG